MISSVRHPHVTIEWLGSLGSRDLWDKVSWNHISWTSSVNICDVIEFDTSMNICQVIDTTKEFWIIIDQPKAEGQKGQKMLVNEL